MKKSILYTALAAMTTLIPFSASANIDFETPNEGYTNIGVYDCWEASPFRTGKLTGNVKRVSNPDKSIDEALGEAPNASDYVIGAQRSRFGSNLFGVRVDLAEKIQLTPDWQYVHVMLHRPVSGRVALVGLGKRTDRDDQTGEEEQFWYLSNNEVVSNKWCDAVFGIKGSADVQIYSLVVVPECESPHDSTEDFLFYIDDIVVNDDIQPRMSAEYYETNYSKSSAKLDRSDRYITSITLTSPAFGTQTANVPQSSDKMLYHFITDQCFRAKAGETVQLSTGWSGDWMHAYVYLDRDDNGHFEATMESNGYVPAAGSDLISHSCVVVDGTGYNSTGTRTSSTNIRTLPNYTIPSDLPAGVYRMRYKIDWSNVDPGGNVASGNTITANGGSITDIILIVDDGTPVTVHANQLNGDVCTQAGAVLNHNQATFGEPFTVKMQPAPGFTYSGMLVRHGVLDRDSLYHDNPQYRSTFVDYTEFDNNDCYTIPGTMIDGDVMIEATFVEEGYLPGRVTLTYHLNCDGVEIATQTATAMVGDPFPTVTWNSEASSSYYSITGMPTGNVTENTSKDIYLTLTQSLPFEVSQSYYSAAWYKVNITNDANYLTHVPGQGYISLAQTTTAVPADNDYNSQWCFVGDVINGFKIYNRGAGAGMILSSSTTMGDNTGADAQPIMTSEPVPAGNNTYWVPTVSTSRSGINGFFLHQLGFPANRMNSRESRLAFWTGGAGAGSTFAVTLFQTTTGIDGISGDSNEPVDFYNLQGMKVRGDNLVPGVYIRVQGSTATKVLITKH